jgi:Carboxypeptidase regulatory-like domain
METRTTNAATIGRLLVLLTAIAAPAWAQVQTGRIVGTVRDAQQATVPKATVTVTATATDRAVNVTMNDRGDYVVTPVDPGFYRVTVAMTGFQTAVVNTVEVPVGQSVRVDVELQVGALSETTEATRPFPSSTPNPERWATT